MTISSNYTPDQYTANGTDTGFGYSFRISAAEEILVVLTDEDGINDYPVLNVDYTVGGAGADAGGTVNFVTAPAADTLVSFYRDVPYQQSGAFAAGDDVPQIAYERGLDRVAMQVQQIAQKLERVPQLPVGTLVTFDEVLPSVVGNAGLYLRVRSNELGFEYAAASGGGGGTSGIGSINGVSNAGGNINLVAGTNISLAADDSANTITINSALAAAVTSVNGATGAVVFNAGTAMDITGTTINFSAAGLSDDSISGNKIDGGTISNFNSVGIDDNATATKFALDDTNAVVSCSSGVTSNTGTPRFNLYVSGAGTDAKLSRLVGTGAGTSLQLLNDSFSGAVTPFSITRSGTTATAVILSATALTFTGALGLTGAATISGDSTFSSTGYLKLPSGNTAARPGSPTNSMVRYNSQTNKFEAYENGAWVNMINTAAGEINTASNVGGATGNVFKQKTTYDLEFKTLAAGSNITITDNASTITIAASGTSGEINTASNVTAGGGVGIYKQKTGVDLELKSLKAGTGITVTGGTSDVTIAGISYVYNVKDPAYGAVGDGSTDDTAAINLAIAALLLTGGVLYFPRGVYIVTAALTPITMTFSGTLHGENIDSKRIAVRGDGPGSRIRYSGSNPGSLTYIMDIGNDKTGSSSGGRDHWWGYVKDLWFDITTASGIATLSNIVGLRLFRMAYWNIENCGFYGLGRGVQLHSALTGNFNNCQFHVNQYAVRAENHADGYSSCNAITFQNCLVSGNTLGGIYFTNGSYSFVGGNVEGNGQNGAGNAFGLRYDRNSSQIGADPTGLSVLGDVYFENNGSATPGKADIWITQTHDNAVLYVIDGPNFNRIGGQYCTNCILVEHNFSNVLGLSIKHCGFSDNGFSPALSEKYFNVTTTTGSGRNTEFGINVYGDVEANAASANAVPDLSTCAGTPYQPLYVGLFQPKSFTLPRKGAKVYRTSNQSIGHSSSTAITFQTALYDDGVAVYGAAIWDGGTKLVTPAGATEMRLVAQMRWNANTTGSRNATIKKGGGGFPCQPQVQQEAGGFCTINLSSGWLPTATGEEIELYALQDSGGALDVIGAANSTTWLEVEYR